MASSDRAFRALAREHPDIVVELLGLVAPARLRLDRAVSPDRVDDPHLDAPPTLDADWIARVGGRDVVHVECQGYRDKDFATRLFRYHLSLVLRYPRRRIHTVALWVIPPPARQRLFELSSRGVHCKVTSVVLPEVPAELLLAGRGTACFAAGANAGGRTDAELCDAVVQALLESGAGEREQFLAAVLAATCGRYDAMVSAMQRAGMEPVIIEDLVRFGMDRGIKQGIEKGIEKGLEKGLERGRVQGRAEALLAVLRARGMALTDEQHDRILTCTDLSTLDAWIERAAIVDSARDVLA